MCDIIRGAMHDEDLENAFPGIGRLYYFLARIAMILVMVFAVTFFGPESGMIGYFSLAISIAATVLDVMRLRNIGASQWLVFLRFLPYVGFVLSVGLQSAQGGWAETKRLDRAGLAILLTHIAIIGLMIYLLNRSGIELFGIWF